MLSLASGFLRITGHLCELSGPRDARTAIHRRKRSALISHRRDSLRSICALLPRPRLSSLPPHLLSPFRLRSHASRRGLLDTQRAPLILGRGYASARCVRQEIIDEARPTRACLASRHVASRRWENRIGRRFIIAVVDNRQSPRLGRSVVSYRGEAAIPDVLESRIFYCLLAHGTFHLSLSLRYLALLNNNSRLHTHVLLGHVRASTLRPATIDIDCRRRENSTPEIMFSELDGFWKAIPVPIRSPSSTVLLRVPVDGSFFTTVAGHDRNSIFLVRVSHYKWNHDLNYI